MRRAALIARNAAVIALILPIIPGCSLLGAIPAPR